MNSLIQGYQDLYKNLKAPPSTDQFKATGQLSPQEFVQAGDKLCQVSPQWQWAKATEKKLNYQYLPEEKQYLFLKDCYSEERLDQLIKRSTRIQETENEEGWVIQREEQKQAEQKVQKDSEESKQEPIIVQDPEQNDQEEQQIRNYTIYITYDGYYYCPRLFLEATIASDDENLHGNPLKPEQVFDDIAAEKVGQTVTIETQPQTGQKMATIHPCKHSKVLKQFADQINSQIEDGVGSHNAILMFLKFFHDVIPTISFDTNFDLNV